MTPAKTKRPRLVEGTVIGVSALAMYGMIAVCAVLTLAGVGMLLAWLFTQDAAIWLLLVGLAGLVCGPAGIAMGIYRLKIKERLIIGTDRFQIVQAVQGKDEVVVQIPFANMARIEYAQGSQSNYVGIDVENLNDPNTYQKKDSFAGTKSVRQFHCIIDPGYTESIATIYAMLAERFQQYNDVVEQ